GVSCVFPAGRLTTLVGPNGAGKSTLLRAIAGLDLPARGAIHAPRDLASLLPVERARQVAWVPDHGDMPFAFTVREIVLMGRFPWHQGAPTQADGARADAAI